MTPTPGRTGCSTPSHPPSAGFCWGAPSTLPGLSYFTCLSLSYTNKCPQWKLLSHSSSCPCTEPTQYLLGDKCVTEQFTDQLAPTQKWRCKHSKTPRNLWHWESRTKHQSSSFHQSLTPFILFVTVKLDQALHLEFYRPLVSQVWKKVTIYVIDKEIEVQRTKWLPRYTQILEERAGVELSLWDCEAQGLPSTSHCFSSYMVIRAAWAFDKPPATNCSTTHKEDLSKRKLSILGRRTMGTQVILAMLLQAAICLLWKCTNPLYSLWWGQFQQHYGSILKFNWHFFPLLRIFPNQGCFIKTQQILYN